jgi:hypothetical protein
VADLIGDEKGSIGKHSLPRGENPIRNNGADVAELVDARDLKSLDGNVVWVRVPPPAPVVSIWAHHEQPSMGFGGISAAICSDPA